MKYFWTILIMSTLQVFAQGSNQERVTTAITIDDFLNQYFKENVGGFNKIYGPQKTYYVIGEAHEQADCSLRRKLAELSKNPSVLLLEEEKNCQEKQNHPSEAVGLEDFEVYEFTKMIWNYHLHALEKTHTKQEQDDILTFTKAHEKVLSEYIPDLISECTEILSDPFIIPLDIVREPHNISMAKNLSKAIQSHQEGFFLISVGEYHRPYLTNHLLQTIDVHAIDVQSYDHLEALLRMESALSRINFKYKGSMVAKRNLDYLNATIESLK